MGGMHARLTSVRKMSNSELRQVERRHSSDSLNVGDSCPVRRRQCWCIKDTSITACFGSLHWLYVSSVHTSSQLIRKQEQLLQEQQSVRLFLDVCVFLDCFIRYTTYIYVTVNPLYPFPAAPEDLSSEDGEESCNAAAEAAAAFAAAYPNPLTNMLICRRNKKGKKSSRENSKPGSGEGRLGGVA